MYKCVKKKKKLGRYLKYQEKNMQCYMLMRLLKTQANHFRTEGTNFRSLKSKLFSHLIIRLYLCSTPGFLLS